jgi:hypothetical protein
MKDNLINEHKEFTELVWQVLIKLLDNSFILECGAQTQLTEN